MINYTDKWGYLNDVVSWSGGETLKYTVESQKAVSSFVVHQQLIYVLWNFYFLPRRWGVKLEKFLANKYNRNKKKKIQLLYNKKACKWSFDMLEILTKPPFNPLVSLKRRETLTCHKYTMSDKVRMAPAGTSLTRANSGLVW